MVNNNTIWINCTKRTIRLYDHSDIYHSGGNMYHRKGAVPIMTFPSIGLRVEVKTFYSPIEGQPPYIKGEKKFLWVTPLPVVPNNDVYFIVPSIYRSAAKELGVDYSRLAVVINQILDPETKEVVGCTDISLSV